MLVSWLLPTPSLHPQTLSLYQSPTIHHKVRATPVMTTFHSNPDLTDHQFLQNIPGTFGIMKKGI